jgi:hypothetical protein
MGAPLYSLAGTSWTLGGAMGVTSRQNGYALGPSLFTNASCKQSKMRIYGRFNCWDGETAASKKALIIFRPCTYFSCGECFRTGRKEIDEWKCEAKFNVNSTSAAKSTKRDYDEENCSGQFFSITFACFQDLYFYFAWENSSEALQERTVFCLKLRTFWNF